MSLGYGLYGQTSFKVANSSKKDDKVDMAVLKRLDVPDYDPNFPADPGNLSYDGTFIKYYNGTSWINLGSGGSIQNAPDSDPTPSPNFLVNSALEIRNIKSRGNGITLNTSGNSLIFNYQPSFATAPSQPYIKLWDAGKYTNITSNTLTISQDVSGNYFIETNADPVENVPDLVPGANFLVDGNSQVKNLRTQGNGIVITTSSTSTIFNYQPSFTTVPVQPHIKLWDSGLFPYVYSNSLSIAQDVSGNYSIELGSSPTPFPAENCANDLSINAAEIVEPIDGKLRLLVPKEGMSITQADPNNNYISFIGYDGKFSGQTTGSATLDFPFSMLPSEAFYYVFTIKGINVTDSKLHYFELRRSITNFGGSPVSSTGTNIYETSGDLVLTPTILSSVNSFSVRVYGLTGKVINWSLYVRKV